MNNENYIVINGKKTKLTEEQLKQLGIEVKRRCDNPFGKITDKRYCYIGNTDEINFTQNIDSLVDKGMHNNANWFRDEHFATQVMLHQQLYRKLLKYAYNNNAEVTKEDWESSYQKNKYTIYFSYSLNKILTEPFTMSKIPGIVFFKDKKTAEEAIEDVVKPFMKEHPEFVW